MDTTVLICSVGGSPEPVRKSIDQQQPEYVLYVASPASRKTIRPDIESALTWHGIRDAAIITLSNFQSLLDCVRDIRAGIERALHDMGLPENTLLIADITGGTKVMSAALTLVMMEHLHSRFAYMGGESRTKSGLGVVESGHETLMRQDNPWDVLALREVRNLTGAFNAGQFATALAIAKELAGNISGREGYYAAVADVVESYALWDGFEHKAALAKLRQAAGRLKSFVMQSDSLLHQLEILHQNMTVLEAVQADAQALRAGKGTLPAECGNAYLQDLLANAARRARAGRYDDAVARLYSAIEKSAKIALLARHGVDNSAVDMLRVPEAFRECLKCVRGEDGVIRIGLQKSFQLLDALGDPLGAAYLEHAAVLEKQLAVRNLSLLAHGYTPVPREAYEKLFSIALSFLKTRAEELPVFPHLEWKSLLI